MRSLLLLIAAGLVAGCVAAAPAAARAIATVPAAVPIGAHGGWVAWSTPIEGGWRLMAANNGALVTPPVALRPEPFDLDLGSDAGGRAVATYTRCAGTRCGIRVLDLATGVERGAGVRRPARVSDHWPSMWRGRIAFARSDPRHAHVDQILLWSPRGRRTRVLRHGAVPTRCPFRSCNGLPRSGTVQGLDLGTRYVAFLWSVVAPAVVGHGGWEVRADRLADNRSFLVGAGFAGEVCTGGADLVEPSTPSVDGGNVWYSLLRSECYHHRYAAVRFRTTARRGREGKLAGEVVRFVRTPEAVFGLVAPRPVGEDEIACAPPNPCELRRLDLPALDRAAPEPRSPFF